MKRFRFVNASEKREEDGIECESFRVRVGGGGEGGDAGGWVLLFFF